jgi:rare lipoprotein A
MFRFVVGVLLVAAGELSAQASPVRSAAPQKPGRPAECGMASWHGGHGITADGRRWCCKDLLAAHRSLPLGAKVRVTNVRNGHQTIVRIADRGPYVRRRIIDLSPAAARQIGMYEAGLAPVRLEVLPPG